MTTKRQIAKRIILIFIVALIVEIFVFNMRFFQSILYSEKLLDESISMSIEGGHLLENGDIELDEGAEYFRFTLSNLNFEVKNIRLDVEIIDEPVSWKYEDHVCHVSVAVWDEALHERADENGGTYLSSGFYDLTEKKVLHSIDSSQYIWTQTYGKTKAVQLDISSVSGQGKVFRINDITFNATEKMHISLVRLLVVFFVLFIMYFVMFRKEVWEPDCVTYAKWKILLPLTMFLFMAVGAFVWAASNPSVIGTELNEYAELADALLQGHVSVGEGSDLVKSLDGNIVFWNIESENVRFDYAYYNGKYYVYFGILPCVVFYVPYRLITGESLRDYVPVVVLYLILIAEIYVFLGMLIRRFYRKTPYVIRMLMTGAAVGGMYIPFCISSADHYMIAIVSGVVLTLAGLMCWLKGWETLGNGKVKNKYGYIAIGTIFMAAVSLCRPTMLLYGIVLLIVAVLTERTALLKQSKVKIVKLVLSVALPYVFFATICMCYNYVRFDSPFDFGASKNMTTIPFNGGRGYILYQALRTIYEYLFAPAEFTAEFPFFTYQGWEQITEGNSLLVINKPDIGFFTGTPVLWAGLLCVIYRKRIAQKKLLLPLAALLSSSFLIMIYTTRFSSFITERYSFEFSFVLFVVAFVGLLELFDDISGCKEINANMVKCVAASLLLAAVFFGMLQIMPSQKNANLICGNTALYYRIYYAMNFML